MVQSHFRPTSVQNVHIEPFGGSSATVSWTASECAEKYEIHYESDSGNKSGNMTLGTTSVNITDLETCGEYVLNIMAIVGEAFSEVTEEYFNTCQDRANLTELFETDTNEEVENVSCKMLENECEIVSPTIRPSTLQILDLVLDTEENTT